MTEQEVAAVTGAGPVGHQPATRAQREPSPETGRLTTAEPGPDLEPGEFGEAPEAEEARDVALREQAILLRAGELTLEPRLSYARTDLLDNKDETFDVGLTARYAPVDNLQVEIGLPFSHVEGERLVSVTSTGTEIENSDEDEFGDVSLGATYGLFGEGLWLLHRTGARPPRRQFFFDHLRGFIPPSDGLACFVRPEASGITARIRERSMTIIDPTQKRSLLARHFLLAQLAPAELDRVLTMVTERQLKMAR